MMNMLGTTLKSHSRIDLRNRKIKMEPGELQFRGTCTSKLWTYEHSATPLGALAVTTNDGMVQVEPRKDIRTNAESASLKNLAKHRKVRGAWQLSMGAKTVQLRNTLNVKPRNPTAMGGDGDMPSGVPEADLNFEDFAPSDQRLDEPPMLPKTREQPQIQPTYPRELIDDDVHSIPPNYGGDSVAGELTMDIGIVESDDIALDDLMKMWDRGTRDEARVINGEIMSIIDSLGGNTSKIDENEERPRGP